jgi:hypothetical protein
MPKYFIFIDESGDPGNILIDGASSKYYAELALQIDGECINDFLAHIISWKYISGRLLESKPLPKKDDICKRYLSPIVELWRQGHIQCSGVYLVKDNYVGPYLKIGSAAGNNPLRFRNYIHRKLLEYHFSQFPAVKNAEIELVFDRYKLEIKESRNLEDYLCRNWNLPHISYIGHADSIYTPPLEVASQLVNAIKDVALNTIQMERKELLSFIRLSQVTG